MAQPVVVTVAAGLRHGLVVAMALLAVGYRRRTALAVGMLSGLTEPVMAVIGAVVLGSCNIIITLGAGTCGRGNVICD
ncbi:hypothetical protein [Alishewanella longhuensis]